jgi:hypothetical protein
MKMVEIGRAVRRKAREARIGKGLTGDDVEFVGDAPEIVILLPIVEYVVQDDVAGAG